MKIGIIGDIHGNLQALTRVLHRLKSEGVMKILCVGDVVGYGPRPQQCIDLMRSLAIPCVLGNHDSWMTNDRVLWGVSDPVRAMVDWTRSVISPDGRKWLLALPKSLDYAGLGIVHATNAIADNYWPYIRDPASLAENFQRQEFHVCFYGHTHIPAIGVFRPPDELGFLPVQEQVNLPTGYRVLVNPGSVGQPRDGDNRAACAVVETRNMGLQFLRVEYNIAQTQREMQEAGLPAFFAERLMIGR